MQSLAIKPKDLLALDHFISHLQEHLESGDNLVDFYLLHYGHKTQEHYPEHQDHEKLPFHHVDFTGYIVYFIEFKNYEKTLQKEYFNNKTDYYISNFYTSKHQNTLLKPPIA